MERIAVEIREGGEDYERDGGTEGEERGNGFEVWEVNREHGEKNIFPPSSVTV
jgi:hypothetical protein